MRRKITFMTAALAAMLMAGTALSGCNVTVNNAADAAGEATVEETGEETGMSDDFRN